MYPQQQQNHVSFTNLQQPYYSPDPFLLSFPQPSDCVLHPPGTDPLGNSILYLSNPTPSPFAAYGAQTTDSQNCIANQASPIRYDLVSPSLLIKVLKLRTLYLFLMLCSYNPYVIVIIVAFVEVVKSKCLLCNCEIAADFR